VPERCYGCVHLRYSGPSVLETSRAMGGTAIPMHRGPDRDQYSPGRYECAKFGRKICEGDKTPRELEAGCKESR
jgi:hypothetical protein